MSGYFIFEPCETEIINYLSFLYCNERVKSANSVVAFYKYHFLDVSSQQVGRNSRLLLKLLLFSKQAVSLIDYVEIV